MTHEFLASERTVLAQPDASVMKTDTISPQLPKKLTEYGQVCDEFQQCVKNVLRPALTRALAVISASTNDVDIRSAQQLALADMDRNYCVIAVTVAVKPKSPRSVFHIERLRLSFSIQFPDTTITTKFVRLTPAEGVLKSEVLASGIEISDVNEEVVSSLLDLFMSRLNFDPDGISRKSAA